MSRVRRTSCFLFVLALIAQVLLVIFINLEENTSDKFYQELPTISQTNEHLLKALKELKETKLKLSELKQASVKILNTEKSTETSTFKTFNPQTLSRPTQLPYDNALFAKLVTVILYREKETPYSCLKSKEKDLQLMFSNLTILTLGSSMETTVGAQFNSLISKVITKYFFFLNSKHDLMENDSDQSVQWLLHALENIPELDFISGSILNDDKLEIPCYRLKLCNWTLSHTYEYYRSIGDLMICDDIASSFIGRTTSVTKQLDKQNLLFDKNITSLSTTDFFLIAKKRKALSGVRPEVYFKISTKKECLTKDTGGGREKYLNLLPFAHKHKVFRFRRTDMDELDLCDKDTSPIVGEDICDEKIAHKMMLDGGHWTYAGTFAYPFIIKNLQYCLFEVTDFLTTNNIPHAVVAGVALGAVKMRGILPWDAGDIDMEIFGGYTVSGLYKTLKETKQLSNYTIKELPGEGVLLFCAPPHLAYKVGGPVTMFPASGKTPEIIQMKTDGRWIKYRKDVFMSFRNTYSINYLEHKMYREESEKVHCNKKGHNACLPDFKSNAHIAGTLHEHFCN